ncbi:MAG TPA: fumarate hydratase C-terminal domain-containing protein [Atribacterota bacterium]|nr:fumarate hydratase C-terminal domain-containing protein [Atribacterota bacterium]
MKMHKHYTYPDLGAEAIHRYYVEGFPAIVCIDAYGNDLYESEPPKYRKE